MADRPRRYRPRRRPDVHAVRFGGADLTIDHAAAIAAWCSGEFRYDSSPGQEYKHYYWSIELRSPEGGSVAYFGDYIVRHGDHFIAMKAGDFEREYEPF